MLISIGQMPCNLICVAAISQQSNPSQISFQFPSKWLHLNISFIDWGQVFFADRPIGHCKFNTMVVEIWEMNFKGRFWGKWRKTDLQIFTELILRMGWVYQLKSYRLRKLFSGCIAPWLYCLAVGLIAKFLWLYCQIFFGYIARWQDSQKILAI